MTRTGDKTRALFDAWARTYATDVLDAGGPLTGYQTSLHVAADLMPAAREGPLLDVGIGTGAFASLVAAPDIQIHGVDVSNDMLHACCEAHPTYALRVGSFTPIPYRDAMFGTVVSSFAFHEVLPDERLTACREIARVMQPGGVFCLLDILFASPEALLEARRQLAVHWDDDEEYPLVAELDRDLRRAGLLHLRWSQTALCHWVVVGRRPKNEE